MTNLHERMLPDVRIEPATVRIDQLAVPATLSLHSSEQSEEPMDTVASTVRIPAGLAFDRATAPGVNSSTWAYS